MSKVMRNEILETLKLGDELMVEMLERGIDVSKVAQGQRNIEEKFNVRATKVDGRLFWLMDTKDGLTSVYEDIDNVSNYAFHFATQQGRWKQDKTFAKHAIKNEDMLNELRVHALVNNN